MFVGFEFTLCSSVVCNRGVEGTLVVGIAVSPTDITQSHRFTRMQQQKGVVLPSLEWQYTLTSNQHRAVETIHSARGQRHTHSHHLSVVHSAQRLAPPALQSTIEPL